jgi:hypothetical protein
MIAGHDAALQSAASKPALYMAGDRAAEAGHGPQALRQPPGLFENKHTTL